MNNALPTTGSAATPPTAPSPERILGIAGGYWAASLLSAGVIHGIFTHVERGARTAEDVAARADISLRGARALLDGLVGIGLLVTQAGRYRCSPDAALYLVDGMPGSLSAIARMAVDQMPLWSRLPEAVRSGLPAAPETLESPAEHPLWAELVLAIAPLAIPVAYQAAASLGHDRDEPLSILDVGGGSGAFSAVLLTAFPEALATQVDWPGINRIALDFVRRFGVGDRFGTIDGDFRSVGLGTAEHDVAIYSGIAHQESAEGNVVMFRRLRTALRPGGTLVISDFVLENDRTGPSFALTFAASMLLQTRSGSAWREADYRAWLERAGFTRVSVERTKTEARLILAR
jgi:SAM-dependent methyltransferase